MTSLTMKMMMDAVNDTKTESNIYEFDEIYGRDLLCIMKILKIEEFETSPVSSGLFWFGIPVYTNPYMADDFLIGINKGCAFEFPKMTIIKG